MNTQEIWNCETPVNELLGDVTPSWIEWDISPMTIASICNGGCASGSYMPAVTYWQALRTMNEHGDAVMQYIEDAFGYIPQPDNGEGWGQLACRYLSTAVELWAGDIMGRLEELENAQ